MWYSKGLWWIWVSLVHKFEFGGRAGWFFDNTSSSWKINSQSTLLRVSMGVIRVVTVHILQATTGKLLLRTFTRVNGPQFLHHFHFLKNPIDFFLRLQNWSSNELWGLFTRFWHRIGFDRRFECITSRRVEWPPIVHVLSSIWLQYTLFCHCTTFEKLFCLRYHPLLQHLYTSQDWHIITLYSRILPNLEALMFIILKVKTSLFWITPSCNTMMSFVHSAPILKMWGISWSWVSRWKVKWWKGNCNSKIKKACFSAQQH